VFADVQLEPGGVWADQPFDWRFIRWMAQNKHMSAIPPTAFYTAAHKHLAEKFIRFCFIKV
jgi:kynurenine--oxoglutarate transaminase/cysteine-S-conjugate beta-lyase/glutamine--phenylpyruvate transaminase